MGRFVLCRSATRSEATCFTVPMTRTIHGACGEAWDQHGDRTSHCGQCHLTFSSLTAFDAHQIMDEGKRPKDSFVTHRGTVNCLRPLSIGMVYKVDKERASVWSLPPKSEWWNDVEEQA